MHKFEALQRDFSQGRITRRQFIKTATTLGLAAAIPNAVLVEDAFANSPKVGGRLRQGLSGGNTSDTLFGVLGNGDAHQVNVQWQLLNNLTEVKANGDIAGELAESWEASPDATKWTFQLRQGVEFHNGKSFEAEDVIHSINVHRGEDSRSIGKGLVADIVDIKADGKHTVVFELESGNADFPFTLGAYHFPIAPAGSMDKEWMDGVGTGPFTLVDWEPGVRAVTKRNPNYFKEGPYFDEVETLAINDVVARMNAIRTGSVDVADKPDLKTLALLEKVPGIKIQEIGGNVHYTFPMLVDQPPFDNADLRLAMKYAVDRELMLETVLNGHGYLGNDHPISKTQRYFNADIPQRQYDPDKAKFHLEKAGMSSFDVTLDATDIYAGGVDAALLYKEQAAKAGININVNRVPTDGYFSNVWNKVPFCVSFWSGRPTEDLMLSLAFSNKSSWNETHWDNQQFEDLLVAARGELDESKRAQMYGEIQQLIHDDGGMIAPVFANVINVISDKIGAPEVISGAFSVDGYKNAERWWFS